MIHDHSKRSTYDVQVSNHTNYKLMRKSTITIFSNWTLEPLDTMYFYHVWARDSRSLKLLCCSCRGKARHAVYWITLRSDFISRWCDIDMTFRPLCVCVAPWQACYMMMTREQVSTSVISIIKRGAQKGLEWCFKSMHPLFHFYVIVMRAPLAINYSASLATKFWENEVTDDKGFMTYTVADEHRTMVPLDKRRFFPLPLQRKW